MKLNKDYRIPFVGLKPGKHTFEFKITDPFFEQFEYSLIRKGNVDVMLELEKKDTMMVGNFFISGSVETDCDRCNDPVEVEVKGTYQLIYKFDTEPSDDETLVILYPEDYEIDINESILEFISVSLPSRAIHKEGECNEEMIEILGEYIMVSSDEEAGEGEDDDEEVDPRWAALKGLKKNKDD